MDGAQSVVIDWEVLGVVGVIGCTAVALVFPWRRRKQSASVLLSWIAVGGIAVAGFHFFLTTRRNMTDGAPGKSMMPGEGATWNWLTRTMFTSVTLVAGSALTALCTILNSGLSGPGTFLVIVASVGMSCAIPIISSFMLAPYHAIVSTAAVLGISIPVLMFPIGSSMASD